MITYVKGDIFFSPAKILVNTVNTVGVMGKGIALEFKKRYPDMFQEYRTLCKEKKFTMGSLMLWKRAEKWVLLFPTKQHWRQPSRLEYIEAGLKKFADNWDRLGVDSIAFPRLGCGNGALRWEDVQPLMEKYLAKLPMQIYIYVGNYCDPKPEHTDVTEMEKWLSGEGQTEGYERFADRLKAMLQEYAEILLPNNHKCSKAKKEGFIAIDDIEVDEKTICDLWNYVRDVGVLKKDEVPHEYQEVAAGFFELLKQMQYISEVVVSKDGKKFSGISNAYQYIAD